MFKVPSREVGGERFSRCRPASTATHVMAGMARILLVVIVALLVINNSAAGARSNFFKVGFEAGAKSGSGSGCRIDPHAGSLLLCLAA